MKPEKKISVFDAQAYLASHFQGTPYDPIGTGNDHDKHLYRPISLAKTQESHILQMNRPGADIQWIAMGVAAESVYVPFFAGINDVPAPYKRGKLPAQLNSAYWIFKHAGILADANLHDLLPQLEDVRHELNQENIRIIKETDKQLNDIKDPEERAKFLTTQSENIATDALNAFRHLSLRFITQLTDQCQLNFHTDENL